MLSENKVTTYLLYAIGEIFLVVVGILIALQINNWNETKKINQSIDDHITILRENITADQLQLIESIDNMTEQFNYADSALLQMQTIIPVDNQLKKYLGKLMLEHRFKPNRNAIDIILQSNELPYLSPELQTAIQDYYALVESAAEREQIANQQIQSKYESYINRHYPEFFQNDSDWSFVKTVLQNDPRKTVNIDAGKFLDDGELAALLASRYYQSQQLKNMYQRLLEQTDTILSILQVQPESR